MGQIGEKIRQRREELHMTQTDLAKRMGYKSTSTVNKVENGVNDITQTTIEKYAEALMTTPAHLMGWDEEENNAPRYSKVDEKIIADFIFDPVKNRYIRELYNALGDITEEEGKRLIDYAKFIASQRGSDNN